MIQYDDFAKIDLRVGTIKSAEKHPDADKLVVLQVDLGSETRQIVAGIAKHFELFALPGLQITVVMNLEPRKLRGIESHGMLLAASDDEGHLSLLSPGQPIKAGSQVK